MTRTSSIVLFLLCLTLTTQAQEWEVPVFKHGDIRVYEKVQGEGRALHRFGPVAPGYIPGSISPDTVGMMSHFKGSDVSVHTLRPIGGEPWSNSPGLSIVYQNEDGVVMKQQDWGYNTTIYPWFVARPPTVDTLVVLDSSRNNSKYIAFTDFERFDTTVFNTAVRAMKYRQAGNRSIVIVAEKFGVVRVAEEGCQECGWYLSSAVLDGVAYNYELKPIHMPKVCPDFEAEYEVKPQEGAISRSLRTVGDTVINGTTYYVYPMFGYSIFRYDQTDVIAYRDSIETIVAPLEIALGSLIVPEVMVVDTFSVKLNGELRLAFTFGWFDNDYAYWSSWLDGAGLYETADWSHFYGRSYQRLVSYKNCGESFTITNIESVPLPSPATTRIFSAPYPNPVSISQGAVELATTQEITQPLTIAVSDVLGRQIYTQRMNPTGPGTALRIPLRNIGPGLYYLSINGASINETKKMVVVR